MGDSGDLGGAWTHFGGFDSTPEVGDRAQARASTV
jgi:hypothetical protein